MPNIVRETTDNRSRSSPSRRAARNVGPTLGDLVRVINPDSFRNSRSASAIPNPCGSSSPSSVNST